MAAPVRAETPKSILFLAEDVPSGLDLDGASASITTIQTGMVNIMEPLFGYATKGVNTTGITVPDFGKFEGRLVESWEFGAKTLIWTLHLRHGVKGCTGNEFTAKDVVYTYERAKSVSGSTPVGWFLANVASVKGFTAEVFKNPAARKLSPDEVKAVDDCTITITQSEPNALLLPAMTIFGTFIFDATAMKAHATEKDPWAHEYAHNVSPASFGPYCVERWAKNQEIIFKANPNYWRGKPAIDRVIMRQVPQSSNRLVILRTGQARLTQNARRANSTVCVALPASRWRASLQLFFVSVAKGGIANESDYSSPYIDETWANASVETDPDKRNALLAEMQEQIMKDVACSTPCWPTTTRPSRRSCW